MARPSRVDSIICGRQRTFGDGNKVIGSGSVKQQQAPAKIVAATSKNQRSAPAIYFDLCVTNFFVPCRLWVNLKRACSQLLRLTLIPRRIIKDEPTHRKAMSKRYHFSKDYHYFLQKEWRDAADESSDDFADDSDWEAIDEEMGSHSGPSRPLATLVLRRFRSHLLAPQCSIQIKE
jgi:hypothetical protein